MLPIAILVSGSGSNLQAILDEIARDPDYGAEVRLVLSDRPGVRALERAEAAGIPVGLVDWADHRDRSSFTTAVCDALDSAGVELVVLAGFMRILGREATDRFPNRIVNVHPSLLPAFPGRHPVRDTLAGGVKVTGVTVHFVDELVDHGPIIAQEAIAVLPGDTEESLHERIQVVEHRLYPAVVKAIAHGLVQVEASSVTWA